MAHGKWSLPVLLFFALGHIALAQPGRGGFNLPKVGSKIPDVTVFDSDGAEFSTKTLRGHYSVLVFGCLT